MNEEEEEEEKGVENEKEKNGFEVMGFKFNVASPLEFLLSLFIFLIGVAFYMVGTVITIVIGTFIVRFIGGLLFN